MEDSDYPLVLLLLSPDRGDAQRIETQESTQTEYILCNESFAWLLVHFEH
jgi:hypothetical protein